METEPLYTVYALTDGLVEDIYDGDSYDEAFDAFVDAERREHSRRGGALMEGTPYSETTVHLYEPHNGILHAELTITAIA